MNKQFTEANPHPDNKQNITKFNFNFIFRSNKRKNMAVNKK